MGDPAKGLAMVAAGLRDADLIAVEGGSVRVSMEQASRAWRLPLMTGARVRMVYATGSEEAPVGLHLVSAWAIPDEERDAVVAQALSSLADGDELELLAVSNRMAYADPDEDLEPTVIDAAAQCR